MSKTRELQVDITNFAAIAGAFSWHVWQSAGILSYVELFGSNTISPRLGVVYTPWRDHFFYASWNKTFSPVGGGLIGITPGAPGNSNDTSPELTRQKEIGVKRDWLDERLSTYRF